MVPAGNKAKRLLLVNHTTKTIHHHHHQEQVSVKLKDFKTVDDSSSFHAFLFKPGALALTAVTQILFVCQAKESMTHVMSLYPIPNVTQLNKMFLRSNTENTTTVAEEVGENVADFPVPGSFVAIAAARI